MNPKQQLRIIQAAVLTIAAAFYFGGRCASPAREPQAAKEAGGYFYVERVVDGDTLKLSGCQRVRLIGVDTPEVHESQKLTRDASRSRKDVAAIIGLGKKAAAFTRQLVEGKKIRLEYDVKKKDRYGRLLGYVYLEDGTFVNARIMEEGYGQVMTIPPNVKYADYFLKLQRQARESGKGLWKESDFSALE
jgi:micrococcal nuclease